MLLVAIGAPLGHPARSLGCNRPLRTLRSRRTRPDTHEIPLLCGRRQRQLFCSRGPPAAEGVEARGGRGGGVRHVLHGIGSVASVGPKGRHAGSPRQVAPAGAGAVLRRAGCRNGLSLGRRSCDGARATSSVSHPSWAVIDAWQWNGSRPSSEITMGRAKLVKALLVGPRCPATDFEQVCGAAQAALRISLSLSFPHHSPALYRVPGVEISTRGFGHVIP